MINKEQKLLTALENLQTEVRRYFQGYEQDLALTIKAADNAVTLIKECKNDC